MTGGECCLRLVSRVSRLFSLLPVFFLLPCGKGNGPVTCHVSRLNPNYYTTTTKQGWR